MEILLKAAEKFKLKNTYIGLPSDSVLKNPPANTGDMGSIPGLGGSQMPQDDRAGSSQLLSQRSARAAATEPMCPRAHAPREKPLQWEACGSQLESGPCSRQLEKAPAQQQRRTSAATNKQTKRNAYKVPEACHNCPMLITVRCPQLFFLALYSL